MASVVKLQSTSYLNFSNIFEYDGETFFDTPDFPEIEPTANDIIIDIDDKYLGRLDLLSYDYYQTAELWWIIALANNLENLPADMYLGMKIRIPDINSVRAYLAKAKK